MLRYRLITFKSHKNYMLFLLYWFINTLYKKIKISWVHIPLYLCYLGLSFKMYRSLLPKYRLNLLTSSKIFVKNPDRIRIFWPHPFVLSLKQFKVTFSSPKMYVKLSSLVPKSDLEECGGEQCVPVQHMQLKVDFLLPA